MKKLLFLATAIMIGASAFAQGYNSKGGSHRGYNTPYTQEEYRQSAWSGSGIAIGTNYIATNHHVVDGATNLYVFFPDTEQQYKAEVLRTDEENDLAIIRISDTSFGGFKDIKYGYKLDTEDVGVDVFVLGYPLVTTMGTEIKLTTGVVSSCSGFQGNQSQYQISAPVQPGNSGGPLFNDDGDLIGIVSAKHAEAENVSYGIKLKYLSNLVSDLPGINFSLRSQIASSSLSEKVKAVRPYTIMILADNCRERTYSYSDQNGEQNPSIGATAPRVIQYPIHINRPQIQRKSDPEVELLGIELTERYTAIYVCWTNTQYQEGWYNISRNTCIIDKSTGQKFSLVDTENCAIAPYKSSINYGQTQHFVLYFEPIPASTNNIDLLESDNSGWRFVGIQLK